MLYTLYPPPAPKYKDNRTILIVELSSHDGKPRAKQADLSSDDGKERPQFAKRTGANKINQYSAIFQDSSLALLYKRTRWHTALPSSDLPAHKSPD